MDTWYSADSEADRARDERAYEEAMEERDRRESRDAFSYEKEPA